MKKYLIGSISHGTMREADLIPRFIDALDDLKDEFYAIAPNGKEAEYKAEYSRIQENLARVEQTRKSFPNEDAYYCSDAATYDLEMLFDELNNFAPPYFYFGAHPGDGSDYGFWLSESWEEEFDGLRVSDTSEVPSDYVGEVMHVSDHGNLTLYAADSGILSEVWGIV